MNGKCVHGLLSGMSLEPYTTQRINCTQLPHQQLFQCLRVVSGSQEAPGVCARGTGWTTVVDQLQRASVHDVRGCVVPVVGALRGAVRKYLYMRACMCACLFACERALARARVTVC